MWFIPMTPVIPTSLLCQECPTCKEACHVWPLLQCPLFLSPSPAPILPVSPSLSGPKSHRCCCYCKQKHNGDFRVGTLPCSGRLLHQESRTGGICLSSVSITAMGSTSPTKVQAWSGIKETQKRKPGDRNQGTRARQASWQAQRQPLRSG